MFKLPKVRNIMMRAKKKKEEAPADAVAVEGAVPAEGAAAPAVDAKAPAKKEEKKK